jgi:hypothetical protein
VGESFVEHIEFGKIGQTGNMGDLLNGLVETKGVRDGSPSPRLAATAAAIGTRFFLHGLRLPPPKEIHKYKDAVDPSIRLLIANGLDTAVPIFAAAGLQHDLLSTPISQQIQLTRRPSTTWFKIDGTVASADVNTDSLKAQIVACNSIQADTLKFATAVLPGWTPRKNRYAPLTRLGLGNGTPPKTTCLLLPADLVEADGEFKDEPLSVRIVKPDDIETPVPSPHRAIAIPVRIKQVYDKVALQTRVDDPPTTAPIPDVYEVVGAVEDDRRILDRLPPGWKADGITLYATTTDGDQTTYTPLSDDNPIVMRANLSVEPGLDAPNTFAAPAVAPELSVDYVNSACLKGEAEKFVELVRFSSFVNSGGFFLLSSAPEIKTIFKSATPISGRPQGASNVPRLLMVIRHRDGVVAPANALLVDGLQGGEIVAIEAGQVLRSGMLPGLLPLKVLMDDPATKYAWTLETGERKEGRFNDIRQMIILEKHWDALTPAEQNANLQKLFREIVGSEFKAIDIVRADILTRFTMLDFVVSGDDFDVRNNRTILPVGPTKTIDNQLVSDKKLGYILPIPLAKFLNKNNPLNDPTDPYGAIGKSCSITLSLRDIYGNRIGIVSTYKIPRIKYTDAILPFWDVQGVSLTYDVDPINRAIVINLSFSLAAVNADDKEHKIGAILRDLTTCKLQIFTPTGMTQPADKVSLRSGIYFRLATTLVNNPDLDQDDLNKPGRLPIDKPGPLGQLRKFLASIESNLQHAVNTTGNSQPINLSETVRLPVQAGQLATADFVPVSVGMAICRAEADVEKPNPKRLASSTLERLTVRQTDIPAAYLGNSAALNARRLRTKRRPANVPPRDQFAQRLQKLWSSANTYWPAVGRAARPGGVREVIWLVRGTLVTPKIATDQPVYAAPIPLANAPVSFSFDGIPVFGTSDKASWHVRDADMDTIGKTMATRIDLSVSGRIAGRLLRSVSGQPAKLPAVRTALDQILQCKEVVAECLAKRVAATRKGGDERLDHLRADLVRDFQERLRRRLAAYFDIDASVSYQVNWNVSGTSPDPRSARHVYVTVQKAGRRKRGRGASAPDYSTDQAPLPINASKAFSIFFDISASKLSLIDPPQFPTQLTYQATHVQRLRYPSDAKSVEGRITQWLTLINPKAPQTIDVTVPVIARQLPKAPTVIQQTKDVSCVIPPENFDAQIRVARQWNFGVDWAWQESTNTELQLTVTYNSAPDTKILSDSQPIRDHIARFVATTDGALWNELMQLSNGGATKDTNIEAFIEFGTAAEALRKGLSTSLWRAKSVNSDLWEDKFTITLPKSRQRVKVKFDPWPDTGKRPRKIVTYDPSVFGALRRDSLSVTNIDALQGVSAWSKFRVSSNIQFNDPFVYVVDGIRAGSALVPHVSRMSTLDITAKRKSRTLSRWLAGAFRALYADGSKLLTDIEIIYRPQTFERSRLKALLEIRGQRPPGTPVAKLAAISITMQDDIDQLVKTVSSQTADWLVNNHIPVQLVQRNRRYIGQLRFRITIFSQIGPAEGAPIMMYEDVVLPLSKVVTP